ncbi:hypothetical protein L3V82_11920 [Thiotrichales bacterium 19S3-7]|nr:hypothetical protein [Thiotrichales bacterium 19S3-7]MCF6802801.1 hypothetical protein [Thiotrichales bacterium 19S3-11]
MSLDNLIQSQVQEALEPVLTKLHVYVEMFSKSEAYKSIRITSAEAARLLSKTPETIHNYVEQGRLIPVDPASRYKSFTLEELERFKNDILHRRKAS